LNRPTFILMKSIASGFQSPNFGLETMCKITAIAFSPSHNSNQTAMNTHAHTQGPWHMGAGNGEGSIFADNGRTRLEIGGTTLYPIAQIGRGWNDAEDEATARLIAAAPEMLEALQSLAHPMASDEDLQNALAVIAKAEGRDA
jgi:hypothetical protein